MPICTMCQNHTPNEFDSHPVNTNSYNEIIQPTGGLHLSIHTGYGMMADPMDQESLQSLSNICLCHDCSIKFIDMFPQEFKDSFFTGGHPVEICREHSVTHMEGCHYAWF